MVLKEEKITKDAQLRYTIFPFDVEGWLGKFFLIFGICVVSNCFYVK
jgi:hypothetical protein